MKITTDISPVQFWTTGGAQIVKDLSLQLYQALLQQVGF